MRTVLQSPGAVNSIIFIQFWKLFYPPDSNDCKSQIRRRNPQVDHEICFKIHIVSEKLFSKCSPARVAAPLVHSWQGLPNGKNDDDEQGHQGHLGQAHFGLILIWSEDFCPAWTMVGKTLKFNLTFGTGKVRTLINVFRLSLSQRNEMTLQRSGAYFSSLIERWWVGDTIPKVYEYTNIYTCTVHKYVDLGNDKSFVAGWIKEKKENKVKNLS